MRGSPIRPQEAVRRVLPLPPERRSDALRRMLRDDPDGLKRALDLLPTAGMAPIGAFASVEPKPVPVRIGDYELRSVLGEGGFGVVWLATQSKPLERSVALKVLRPDRLDPSSRARFDMERRLLALLDHPSLVKVFDAGESEDGRPWFTMELAQGAPITEAADAARLGVEDRLRLLAQVARAVHHAHSHGLVHRDLKPANILLAVDGDQLQVKVIDFGVAHAAFAPVDPDQHAGAMVGTPDYLAPELSRLRTVAPDVRADVFALGVVLRRLLSGNDPSDRRASPSASLLLLDAVHQRHAAEDRRESVASLRRRLEGDIDAITARCLADDPRARYPGALELAQDIDRHLRGEVVLARGDSIAYHGLVAARQGARTIAAAMLVLLVAITGFVWAMHERGLAIRARDEAEASARRERDAHTFIVALLGEIAGSSNVSPRTAVDLLDQASVLAGERLRESPSQEGLVRQALASLYHHLGAHERAIREFGRAEGLLKAAGRPQDAAALSLEWAAALSQSGRPDEARSAAQRALTLARSETPEDQDDVAQALLGLADAYRRNGQFEQARQLVEQASQALDQSPSDPSGVREAIDRSRRELGQIPPDAPSAR